MNEYTVLIIDDEYVDRKKTYLSFFEKKYKDDDITFKVIPISTVYEFNCFCREWKHVDAVFLDASLDDTFIDNETYCSVLRAIEDKYSKRRTPPVFMVSKSWKDPNNDLLMNVSINISTLHKIGHPSAYYDFKRLASIVEDADSYLDSVDKEITVSKLDVLKSQRLFIKDEIEKNHAMEKVDAVIILAVTDEKTKTYQVFDLNDDNDKSLAEDGLTYQRATIDGKQVAFVTQKNMGLTEAARATESAIRVFEPSVVIMGGICAGKEDTVKLGSIVVPKQIYEYSSGKISTNNEGKPIFEQRLASVVGSAKMSVVYQHAENATKMLSVISEIQTTYKASVPDSGHTKKVVTYPMASGPWVVDSKDVFEIIKNNIPNDKFCAIDMEAYAVASVADTHGIPWLVVKTVQDYADGKKAEKEAGARDYALYSSAMFIKMQLNSIIEYAHPCS